MGLWYGGGEGDWEMVGLGFGDDDDGVGDDDDLVSFLGLDSSNGEFV